MVLRMTVTRDALRGKLRGTLRRTWARGTQESKRALVRLGIVPRPFRISIDITDRCNFRCPTCSKWRRPPSSEELDLGDWEVILERLRGMALLNEVTIAGGEPFTHPDCLSIVEAAKTQGFRTVLISNGWFINEERLEAIEDAGLDTLMISLNSLAESVHDQSRGSKGSHGRIMEMLESWRARGRRTRVSLLTVILDSNRGELVELARFARDMGLGGVMFQVLLPTEVHYSFAAEHSMPRTAEGWHEANPLWVRSPASLGGQIGQLLELQAAGYPVLNPASQLRRFVTYYEDPESPNQAACLGTQFRLHIDPLGAMRLCYGFPTIGNALQDDPLQAWRGARARQIRSASKGCARPCRMLNCNL
jgi:MoaA/NifB/PqqE/SkfB family radical SAM enzyme